MPREHASALCHLYSKNLNLITVGLRNDSLRVGQLNDVDISKRDDGEYLMKFKILNTPKHLEEKLENSFSLTKEQIQLLITGMFNTIFIIY